MALEDAKYSAHESLSPGFGIGSFYVLLFKIEDHYLGLKSRIR